MNIKLWLRDLVLDSFLEEMLLGLCCLLSGFVVFVLGGLNKGLVLFEVLVLIILILWLWGISCWLFNWFVLLLILYLMLDLNRVVVVELLMWVLFLMLLFWIFL